MKSVTSVEVVTACEVFPQVGEYHTLVLTKPPQTYVSVERSAVKSRVFPGSGKNPGHNYMRGLVFVQSNGPPVLNQQVLGAC